MSQGDYSQEFDAMFAHMARRSRGDRYVPNTDVYKEEDDSRVIVQLELAGLDCERLNLEADDRALYISGVRLPQSSQRSATCLLKEIEYGDFERKVPLPFAIDHAQAIAQYEDGILIIELLALRSEVPKIIRTEIQLVFRRTTR